MLPVTVSCRVRTFLRASCNAGGRLSTPYYTAMTREAFESSGRGRRLLIWADEPHEHLIAGLLTRLQMPAVIASPRESEAARLAESLGLAQVADLRRTVIESDQDVLLLLSRQPVVSETLEAARGRAISVLSLRPPMSLPEVEAATALPDFIPRFIDSPVVRSALDVLTEFGPREFVHLMFRGPSTFGPLAARLADAMETIDHLLEPCEQVDATQPARGGKRPPQTLADLDGVLTAIVRFDGPMAAGLTVSDDAPDWSREVTILGPRGVLRITDYSYAWLDETGRVVDQSNRPSLQAVDVLARAILAHLDPASVKPPPPAWERILSLCEAARLSVLTGQGESPHKLRLILSQV